MLKHQVCWFNVSVQNAGGVQCLQGACNLLDYPCCILLTKEAIDLRTQNTPIIVEDGQQGENLKLLGLEARFLSGRLPAQQMGPSQTTTYSTATANNICKPTFKSCSSVQP